MSDAIKKFAQKNDLKYLYGSGAYGISRNEFRQIVNQQLPLLVSAVARELDTRFLIDDQKMVKTFGGRKCYHMVAIPEDTNMDNHILEVVVTESVNDDAYVSAQLYE